LAGLLFAEQGDKVPVNLVVIGRRDNRGQPVQVWSRRFKFTHTRRFQTYVEFDGEHGVIVDRIGPGRILAMESVMEWRLPGELVMQTTGWSLRALGQRITLPTWMFGSVTGVQTVRPSGRMGIAMRVTHPLLGDIFGYEGTVTLRSEENG
jgi:hypothetical protein